MAKKVHTQRVQGCKKMQMFSSDCSSFQFMSIQSYISLILFINPTYCVTNIAQKGLKIFIINLKFCSSNMVQRVQIGLPLLCMNISISQAAASVAVKRAKHKRRSQPDTIRSIAFLVAASFVGCVHVFGIFPVLVLDNNKKM